MPDPLIRSAADRVPSAADPAVTTDPTSSAAPAPAPPAPGGRYLLGPEIARGGMGKVYRATDTALGREVAVKVLRPKYTPDSGAARRFADEARITAQLQHPGVPPVHDLGALPDGRPFLAMKLIKGDTLDELLGARSDPAADRGRLVAAFEQVCQAVAYAHAHGVVHRDLKPQNVMVGAFGEVQVMDWGLAKVLAGPEGERAEADPEATAARTDVRSLRDGADLLTQAGTMLGTPAYMPPEQALGAVHEIDRRSDVFGLGGILAAVLTGRPPFLGGTTETTRVMAARGEVAGCFARLDGCGADPELVALAKRCLAPKREDRPAEAGEVARAVAQLRAAADERARRAELDKVRMEGEAAAAEAEARAQRQKRRVQLLTAASVFGLLVVGAVGWLAVRAQAEGRRADAARVAGVALGRAEQLCAQAAAIDPTETKEAVEAVRLWEQAEAAVGQAQAAVGGAGDPELAGRVEGKAAEARAGLTRARRNADLLSALDDAGAADQGTSGGGYDRRASVAKYRAAFAAAGLPAAAAPEELAAAIRAEPPGLRGALVRAMDDWAVALLLPPGPDGGRVRAALGLLDPDPFRQKIRAAAGARNLGALVKLAGAPEAGAAPPSTVDLLVRSLGAQPANLPHLSDAILRILRGLRARHPSDFEVLKQLMFVLEGGSSSDPIRSEEALSCAWALVAAHPDRAFGYYQLGRLYQYRKGDPLQAEPLYLKAIELNPRFGFAMINLGMIIESRGDLAGAARLWRRAAEVNPTHILAHYNVGCALQKLGDLDGSIAAYREALRLYPGYALAKQNLARSEQMRSLLPRLPGALAGTDRPHSATEALGFADLCRVESQRRYAAATRFYGEAFAADPALPDDWQASHAYYAACYALRAARGEGVDAPTDPAGRSALRAKALGWLRAFLAIRQRQANSAKQAERLVAVRALLNWLSDPQLAEVRDPGPLAKLPAAEREDWEKFWADVKATLADAQKPTPPAGKEPGEK